MKFHTRLRNRQRRVEQRLRRLLPSSQEPPRRLHRAMRYSVLNGGKRIRPVLVLETAALFGAVPRGVEYVACAVECIHCYSLVHDDLPALDNDDLRRGRPTCHKRFGEATAILAGDALLTLAFEIVSKLKSLPERRRTMIVQELAMAAGTRGGMIAGQVADLEAERRRVSARQLEAIHRGKTGALIRAAVRCGALAAGASRKALARLTRYGESLGLAFQIVDDILDVQSSTAQLGKAAGKDASHGKATYPGVHGLEKSARLAEELVTRAHRSLAPFGSRAEPLRQMADFLLQRTR